MLPPMMARTVLAAVSDRFQPAGPASDDIIDGRVPIARPAGFAVPAHIDIEQRIAGCLQIGDEGIVGAAAAIEHVQEHDDGRVAEFGGRCVEVGDDANVIGALTVMVSWAGMSWAAEVKVKSRTAISMKYFNWCISFTFTVLITFEYRECIRSAPKYSFAGIVTLALGYESR